ncbi:hypothetical protein KALB_8598 [Kutzneria albida DSM 43870]|uniref:Integral membrane bound transporter domain-containing protein n=1 Tax=Kutzneria albida DSM 43870 TaxID=1449976 RepID=W5WUW5_9PSEU|nr:hypothetical protein KALB_8598 [Kutzneria albida DSM 43870]
MANRVFAELRRRLRRLQRTALPIGQAGVAAGGAWLIATELVGHPHPFFAPSAAVTCLGVAMGQRLRRVVELVVGVSVGVGIGDLLISRIGSGTWQIVLVVVLAMAAAVLLDGGAVIALQSGTSAVLVATLLPPSTTGGYDRMVDALIGGATGLAAMALLPANPLTLAHRHADTVLRELGAVLRAIGDAVTARDAVAAAAALTRARASQRALDEFKAALVTGTEVATIAPIRWRRRGELDRYKLALGAVDLAIRNTRVLARRAMSVLRDEEDVPQGLPLVLNGLADCADALRRELARQVDPVLTRALLRDLAARTDELLAGAGFSVRVVVAQLRSIIVDLLVASGVSRADAIGALPALPEAEGA